MIDYMKEYRIGPDGKATFAIVQAEDELAAIGMVIGAGWAGARSMTATAGPGISLMSEFAGLAYYVEVPGVIWDIQRVGPSTGLPTRTSQGDILSTAFLSHGDTKNIMLLPCSVDRVLQHGARSLQPGRTIPDAGLRHVRSRSRHEQLDVRSRSNIRRRQSIAAKFSSKEDLDRLGGFARYKDVDGDGIGYRTLPGNFASRGGLFRPWQRPQRKSPIQRTRRRLRKQYGAPEPQIRNRALFRSPPRNHEGQQTRKSASSVTEPRIGESPKAAISCATNTTSRPIICGFGRIHSRAKCMNSSSSTIAFMWSSRIATRKCSAAQTRSQARTDHAPAQHRPHHRAAARCAVHHR